MRVRALTSCLIPLVLSCSSSGGSGEGGRPREKAAPQTASPAAAQPAAPAKTRFTGTFEGSAEAPPVPEGAAAAPAPAPAWTGNGAAELEQEGAAVTGTLEGSGIACKVRGTLADGAFRGWLSSDGAPGSRLMGFAEGTAQGDAIRGTWRLSTSGGVEVRKGAFQVTRAAAAR